MYCTYTVHCIRHLSICMSMCVYVHVTLCTYPSFLDELFIGECGACISLINGEQTCTHCTCQPCTQREHVACIAVLLLFLVLLVILLILVVFITTYVPFFYIALGDISQEGLMSKEEVGEIQKNWESWTALNHICAISYTKEPSEMTRIAGILQKSGFTGAEAVMLLKGGTILL